MLLRSSSLYLALLTIGWFASSNANADTISTWNGGSGNWSTAGQWTPSQIPNNTATQSYDVTIGNGAATLDISPTINSLILNGGLATGSNISNGQRTTLTVNGNATVNGAIAGNPFYGWFDSLAVGGNLTNTGYMKMGSNLSVGGNLQNSGTLSPMGVYGGFSVNGTLVNTGTLQWGDDEDAGAGTTLGGLVNKGSIFIAPGTNVGITGPAGVTDIPKGASWFIGGGITGGSQSQSAFAHLAGIEGSLDVEGSNLPLVLGSNGNTIHNSGSFQIGSGFGDTVVTVLDNLSNSGNLAVAYPGGYPYPPLRQRGSSTLNIAGNLTNQATGTLSVNSRPDDTYSPSALNVQNLVNYGTANFQFGTASTAQRLENAGTMNIGPGGYNGEPSNIGSLAVGTLKLDKGGVLTVWEMGGLLTVGSGTVPAGFTGYDQFGNGELDLAGGELDVQGPVDLNGTLNIMLGNGPQPIGAVFTVLTGGPVTGTFSNIEGDVFDGGRERYLITYGAFSPYDKDVTLTVESNTTPEPGSVVLVLLGLAGILVSGGARKRSRRIQ